MEHGKCNIEYEISGLNGKITCVGFNKIIDNEKRELKTISIPDLVIKTFVKIEDNHSAASHQAPIRKTNSRIKQPLTFDVNHMRTNNSQHLSFH